MVATALLPAACRKSTPPGAPVPKDGPARSTLPASTGAPGAPVPPPSSHTGGSTGAPTLPPAGAGTAPASTPPGSTAAESSALPAVGTSCTPIATVPGVLNPCGHAWAVAYSPDGRLLATGGSWRGADVHLWRMPDGASLLDLPAHGGRCYDLAFSPDGKLLASAGDADAASGAGMVKLWDVAAGALVRAVPVSVPAGVDNPHATSVSFSHDGTRLATAGGGPVEIWSVADGARVRSLATTGTVYQVRFSPDDARLLAAGTTGKAQVWELDGGQPLLDGLATAHDQASADFSPDGKLIASNGTGGTVALWDAATGALLDSATGHAPMMGRVVWVDGTRLLSNDWNGKVILWQLGADGKLAATRAWVTGSPLRDVADGLNLAVSPDRQRVVVGSVIEGQAGFVFLAL